MYKPKTKYETKVNPIKTVTPNIFIKTKALIKMDLYVEHCKDEIGWFGFVSNPKPHQYVIEDVVLFEQRVHGATTEVNEEILAKFAEKMLEDTNGMDKWNKMKLWGHSHVNMAVSPSGQDDNQMEFFSKSGHDFFIRVIANKKGDMKFDIYNYDLGVMYSDVPWIEYPSKSIMDKHTQIKSLKEQIDVLQAEIDGNYGNEKKDYSPAIKAEVDEKAKPFVYESNTIGFKSGYPIGKGYWYQGQYYSDVDEEQIHIGFRSDSKVVNEKKITNEKNEKLTKESLEIIEMMTNEDVITVGQSYNYQEVREIVALYKLHPTYHEVSKIWDACKEYCRGF